MAPAKNALTTVAAVKEYLRIATSDTANDGYLNRLVNAVSEWVEKECNRKFGKDTYTHRIAGNGKPILYLEQYPILVITSVKIEGQLIDSGEYEAIPESSGGVFKVDGWPWKGYFVGLVGEPTGAERNIEIQYDAGFVLPKDDAPSATPPVVRTLPYDLEDAVIELVAIRYNMRDNPHLKRETIGPLTSEFIQQTPEHIHAVMNHYRKWVL